MAWLLPPVGDLLYILQKYGKERNIHNQLHLCAYMSKIGLHVHKSLGNVIISVLVEAGNIHHALDIFYRQICRNEYSWNSVIIGCSKYGEMQHALMLYKEMQGYPLCQNKYTFVALLKACTALKDLKHGHEIHAEISRKQLFVKNVFVGSALVDLYSKCGSLMKAKEVFERLLVWNVVSWNALISGYAEHGCGEETLTLFDQMQQEGIHPDDTTFVCCLKACSILRTSVKGKQIHAGLAGKELEKNNFVMSTLVSMYAKCGSLVEAQKTFDNIKDRNVVLWNALIGGYAENGHDQQAVDSLLKMQQEQFPFNDATLVSILKSCGNLCMVDMCQELHAEICKKGLEGDLTVGSSLVDMYAKCGYLLEAEETFGKLLIPDVVSCTALVAGYVEHGFNESALYCFEQMQLDKISPGAITFSCILRSCGCLGNMVLGLEIHTEIILKGIENELLVCCGLIYFYAKCVSHAELKTIFGNITAREPIIWDTFFSACLEYGYAREVLQCFKQMQDEGVPVKPVTYTSLIKACRLLGDVDSGLKIHSTLLCKGFDADIDIVSDLAEMYASCGLVVDLSATVGKSLLQSLTLYNAILTGYAEHGLYEEAIDFFEFIIDEGFTLDAVSSVCVLKICGYLGLSLKGRDIHSEVVKKGLETDNYIGNTLVDIYAKCGLLTEAQAIFDKLQHRTVVLWTTLISGYTENGHGLQALSFFEEMQHNGISPSPVTFLCILKACGTIGSISKISDIYQQMICKGYLEEEISLGSSLVDVYSKCGSVTRAIEVFNTLPSPNVVTWNALITALTDGGYIEDALRFIQEMQQQGICSMIVTYICLLKACSMVRSLLKGYEVHCEVVKRGLERDTQIGNTLVSMYVKCLMLIEAQKVFDMLPVHDTVAWTALLTGYTEQKAYQEVLNLLQQLQVESIYLNSVLLISVLKACATIGSTVIGQTIHAETLFRGLECDTHVGNALVDMYAKCGLLPEANYIFDKIPIQDLVSWTALIVCYAQLGDGENVVHMLNQMMHSNVNPDYITLLTVLNACSHAGLVGDALIYMLSIGSVYGLSLTFELYVCLVDVLGRAGHTQEAVVVIREMPFQPSKLVWLVLLGACRKCGDLRLAAYAFENSLCIDASDSAAYISMSNIYAEITINEIMEIP